jgi:hypothetical protein
MVVDNDNESENDDNVKEVTGDDDEDSFNIATVQQSATVEGEAMMPYSLLQALSHVNHFTFCTWVFPTL